MKFVLLPLLFVAFVQARSVYKRNAYGDEQMTPAPAPEVPAVAAPEEAVHQVPAETADKGTLVEHSGYRKKREGQNSYGDEPVAAAKPAEYTADAPTSPATEQAVEQIPAETADKGVPVEHSGYRKKREAQNSYGDEPVTEAPKPTYASEPVAVEQAVEKVPTETAANEAPVEKSGY